MKSEYETRCAEAEEVLRLSGVHLPLSWMVSFLLDYAETGMVDPDELQDIAQQVRSGLENAIGEGCNPDVT